jgi:hypothetical protein
MSASDMWAAEDEKTSVGVPMPEPIVVRWVETEYVGYVDGRRIHGLTEEQCWERIALRRET